MSIEYFVEGKVITQTGGDHLNFSKEDITHNSIYSVNQQGTNTGVSFNKPTEIHPDDTPVNIINVSLNLFFDGTQNNKTNTESGPQNSASNGNDSYGNDYSNVAKGYDAINTNAEKQVRVYIEGIGTVDNKRDTLSFYSEYPNNIGSPLGMGNRGIESKVTKGCLEGAESLGKKFKGKNINAIEINVFGFSRGAAAARHFIHIASTPVTPVAIAGNKYAVNPPKRFERSDDDVKQGRNNKQNIDVTDPNDPLILNNGYFGACLINNGIKANYVIFNFIGLYDTVASFGINHKGYGVFIGSDAEQLNLNAVSKANFTLQIASSDEYRENFSLTDVRSTGKKGLEITLPGVYSDIGGSYVDGAVENSYIHNGSKPECEEMKKILIEEGWFLDEQLHIFKIDKYAGRLNCKTSFELRGTRNLSNHYNRIPLTVMFHYSKHFAVKYLDSKILRNYAITNSQILTTYSSLLQYINIIHEGREDSASIQEYRNLINSTNYLNSMQDDLVLLKIIRNQYLHWSVNVGPDGTGMGPHVKSVTTANKRKRYIIPG